MEVKLLSGTPNAESIIYAAFRQCYSPGFVGDLWEELSQGKIDKEKQIVSYTFAIQGISRALTHQLVRHRLASYSQQSQRYVNAEDFQYITPPSIENIPEAKERYEKFMKEVGLVYSDLQKILQENGKGKKSNEDARFVLPQGVESKIVVTMNCRSFLHFFELRCCERAQWEIREMAWAMLNILKEELPVIFNMAGPKCERLGCCPEGDKFTCGKYPVC